MDYQEDSMLYQSRHHIGLCNAICGKENYEELPRNAGVLSETNVKTATDSQGS